MFLKYIGTEPTKVCAFTGSKIDVSKNETFECEDKRGKQLKRAYSTIFKQVEKLEEKKEKKKNK